MKRALPLVLLAAAALAEEPTLEVLFDRLGSEDPSERQAAAQALTERGVEAAAEAERRLADPAVRDAEVRGRLAEIADGARWGQEWREDPLALAKRMAGPGASVEAVACDGVFIEAKTFRVRTEGAPDRVLVLGPSRARSRFFSDDPASLRELAPLLVPLRKGPDARRVVETLLGLLPHDAEIVAVSRSDVDGTLHVIVLGRHEFEFDTDGRLRDVREGDGC